jgi:DNA-binding GntR family transcriptional regulator
MSANRDLAPGGLIDHISARIRDEILQQRLRPGGKLAAEHLATMLNVSRTPVRQALERLAQEGFVVRVPSRGFFVAEIAADEVRDLYDVRIALELHACASAFDRGISADGIAAIEAADGTYQKLVQGNAIATRADADQAFHLCLAGLSGNAVLVKMLGENFGRLNFRRRYDGYWFYAAASPRSAEAASEHRLVLDAIGLGDREAALAALRRHLDRAWDNYNQFLKTSAEFGRG